MPNKNKFTKPALNLDNKIKLLKKRGLIFNDEPKAKHDLIFFWYFRLTWYFKTFQDKKTNAFHKWTTFEQVIELYIFDRKLRILTLDAVEKIEVALKANISDNLAEQFWVFWYLNINLFDLKNTKNLEIYSKFISKLKWIRRRSSSLFIKEYFKKYDENYLPSWMLFEECTIWEISNIYNVLKSKHRQDISNIYWLYELDLQIWIKILMNLRNISAHHSRLWNKEYIIKPRLKDKVFWSIYQKWVAKNNNIQEIFPNYYNNALIINYMLNHINKNLWWLDDLEKLFNEYTSISIEKMWFNRQSWKNNF